MKFGKKVYPYTGIEAVLDVDGRTLQEIIKTLTTKFELLELSVNNGQLIGPKGEQGEQSKNIELRKSTKTIQWRVSGSTVWTDLIQLNDLIPTDILHDSEGNVIDVLELATKEFLDNSIQESIEDNLTSESTTKSLSAYQGKILQNTLKTIMNYIGKCSFDEDGQLIGLSGPSGVDGKNIELRTFENKLQWRLLDELNWIDLIDLSTLTSSTNIPEDYLSSDYLKSIICQNLELDPDYYLLTAAQGRIFQEGLSNLYEYMKNFEDGNIQGINGTPGEDGRNPEFREFENSIQWRLLGDTDWITVLTLTPPDNSLSIENTLESESTSDALSAYQGNILNTKISSLIELIDGLTFNGVQGETGKDGSEIELSVIDNVLQWKYKTEDNWKLLIDISTIAGSSDIIIEDILSSSSTDKALSSNKGKELNDKLEVLMEYMGSIGVTDGVIGIQGPPGRDGRDVEFQTNDKYVQWKFITDSYWNDLILLSALSPENTMDMTPYSVKSDIVDDLVSNDSDKPLSAKQGQVLNDLVKSLYDYMKGITPNGTEGNPAIATTVVDNIIEGGSSSALSAEQGKILGKTISNINKEFDQQSNLNLRLAKSLFEPGYISINGSKIIEVNEWVTNYYEDVVSNTVYTFTGDVYCSMLRWSWYTILNGEITLISNEVAVGKSYVTIKAPSNAFFVKLGFNTSSPNNTFLHYELIKG